MSRKALSDLRTELNAEIFPTGVPENLVQSVGKFYIEALIDMQRWIPCMQSNNTTIYDFCNTFFDCGLTITDLPQGTVKRVFTIADDNYCQPVILRSASWDEMTKFKNRMMAVSTVLGAAPKYVAPPDKPFLPPLNLGVRYADKTSDSKLGRSKGGIYCIQRGRLYIAPWINSNEKAVVEWDGIKREWKDLDLVTDDGDVTRALKLYVQYCYARDYERDAQSAAEYKQEYENARADLSWQCREDTRQRHDDRIPHPVLVDNSIPSDEPVTTPDAGSLVLAIISDYGIDDGDSWAVSRMVQSWAPDVVATAGNNNMSGDDSVAGIDRVVGRRYGNFINPYIGTFGTGGDKNRFWPAIGNYDRSTSNLFAQYKNFFAIPAVNGVKQDYYDVMLGPVHLFILDSGLNGAGQLVQPDGNTVDSVQALWLRLKLAASVAPFKIVMFNYPAYTSSNGVQPLQAMRWPFKDWGATAVISGHVRSYERLLIDGMTYIVNGLGGFGPIYPFGAPTVQDGGRASVYALTKNIDLSTLKGGNTFQGVTVAANDVVLVMGQNDTRENGFFVVGAIDALPTRIFQDYSEQLTEDSRIAIWDVENQNDGGYSTGSIVYVMDGSTKVYYHATSSPPTDAPGSPDSGWAEGIGWGYSSPWKFTVNYIDPTNNVVSVKDVFVTSSPCVIGNDSSQLTAVDEITFDVELITTTEGSIKQYSDDYGALKLVATCKSLSIEFHSLKDGLVDKYEVLHT